MAPGPGHNPLDSAVLKGRMLFLLIVLGTRASLWDPWVSRQSILDLCKLSLSQRAWALKKAHLYYHYYTVCLKSWTVKNSSLQAVKCNNECGIKIRTDWNKEGLTWSSEKQHNTFYICISMVNTQKLIHLLIHKGPTYWAKKTISLALFQVPYDRFCYYVSCYKISVKYTYDVVKPF